MSTFGLMGLVIAFAGVVVSVVCLLAGRILKKAGKTGAAETASWGGCVASILTAVALTVCCGILVFCFMTGDMSIEYVLMEHSDADGALGVLYRFRVAAVLGVAYFCLQRGGGRSRHEEPRRS